MNNDFDPIALFVKNTKYQPEDIQSCTKIKEGFSNLSYHLITNDCQEFQVRFGQNNHIIFRSNEQAIMKAIKLEFVYYNPENGDSIRRWFHGVNPRLSDINEKFLKLLVAKVEKIHQAPIEKESKIIIHDNYCFWKIVKDQLEPVLRQKYQSLTEKYADLPKVISHNDVSLLNVIWDQEQDQLEIIDFEWGRINNCYWDYANFIRESQLDYQWWVFIAQLARLDLTILSDHVFLTTFFAAQWARTMPPSPELEIYKNKVDQLSWKYYKMLYLK